MKDMGTGIPKRVKKTEVVNALFPERTDIIPTRRLQTAIQNFILDDITIASQIMKSRGIDRSCAAQADLSGRLETHKAGIYS